MPADGLRPEAKVIEIDLDRLQAGPEVVLERLAFRTQARALLVSGNVASGKTLLARALCGDFFESDWIKVAGHARLGAHFIQFATAAGARGPCRVGFLPQTAMAFFVAGTVANEMLAAQLCCAETFEAAEKRLANWSMESPIAGRGALSPLALSGGEQRLFMLENVLSTSPDHLVIDGGMASLDRNFRLRAAALIRSWLDADPRRTFLCFGGALERSWFEFEDALSLSPDQAHQCDRLPSPRAGHELGDEILGFRAISAGPVITGRRLLRNISLSVRAGTFVGLRGANGIGKSTLLRLVAGVRRPVSGEVYFRGERLPRIAWPGLADGIGYLPQEPELAGPGIGTLARRLSQADAGRRRYWQDFFRMEWTGDSEAYWSMSSGQRARASLMLQAMFGPLLWILDEPTFRIDPAEIIRFLAALRAARPETSAIIVSHDEAFLDLAADEQHMLTEDRVEPLVPT
jgi:ABC-type multidrug transport system ATPase subunit